MAWGRFRVARTTEALRAATTYLLGEFILPTDGPNAGKLYMGDGVTVGGNRVGIASTAMSMYTFRGLDLQNNGVAPQTRIDVTAGRCRDRTDAYDMILAATMTKRLDAVWAIGSGNGGLDTGVRAANTWYWVHLIRRNSDGAIDVLLSTSFSAPTMPAGWSALRTLHAFLTDASSNILAGRWFGDDFEFASSVTIVSGLALSAATLQALIAPVGPKVRARFLAVIINNTAAGYFIVRDPDLGVPTVAAAQGSMFIPTTAGQGTLFECWTDTARQVYLAATAAGATLNAFMRGFEFPRALY